MLGGINDPGPAPSGGSSSIQFNDNVPLEFGDDKDATILFNGTDTIWNARAVGSGNLVVTGDVCAANATGPCLVDEASTSTNPTVIPNQTDKTLGMGWEPGPTVTLFTADVPRLRVNSANFLIGSGIDVILTGASSPIINNTHPLSLGTLGTTGVSGDVVIGSPGQLNIEAGAHIVFSIDNDAATPSIQLEPGSGFYAGANNQVFTASNGVGRFLWILTEYRSSSADGPSMVNAVVSSTVPGWTFVGDLDTGLGSFGADAWSLIGGGVELVRGQQNDAATDVVLIGPGTRHDGYVTTVAVEAQTTDATVTVLDNFTLLDENTYHVEALVSGVQSDGANRATYHLLATVYRTGAGAAAIQGTVTTLHTAESDANWDANFTVSSNDVRVSVTGVAATTIEWGSTLTYINMSN